MELSQTRRGRLMVLTLCRPERHNTLSRAALAEIGAALDEAEADPALCGVLFQGQDGVFCTGMDLALVQEGQVDRAGAEEAARLYFRTLVRLRTLPKAVVSLVDGRAVAGGIGLVAASDLVVASRRASFRLPEALLGLLPASVLPFLAQRIGLQRAWHLTLSARTVAAEEALHLGLADELCEEPGEGLRRAALALDRLGPATLARAKSYMKLLWGASAALEEEAVAALTAALAEPATQARILELQRHDLWQRSG